MSETTPIDLEALAKPFEPKDVEWRIGQAGRKGNGDLFAKVLAYITNRAIMNRLDDVCGPANWRNEFIAGPQGGVLCGISVWINGQWVTKWDGAENTDIEAIKGGLSDAMKRAGVQWGIGRYLYNLDEGWAEIGDKGEHYANCKIKVKGQDEWVNFRWSPPKLPAWAIPKPVEPKAPPKKAPDKPAETPYIDPEVAHNKIREVLSACDCKSPAEADSVSLFVCGIPYTKVKNSGTLCRDHYQKFIDNHKSLGDGLKAAALKKHPASV